MKANGLFGTSFSILGDSYSTFRGYIPEGCACYYPQPYEVDDVLSVEDTWWHNLIVKKSMVLLQNNSYSGSTVCTQVRETQPQSCSFVERVKMNFCGKHGEEPEWIFVFGGTNDSWIGREIGSTQYANWDEDCLKKVLPAYCYVLDYLTTNYKNTTIVCLVDSQLHPQIAEGTIEAASYYGAISVVLQSISKQNGHPTRKGMRQISDLIDECLTRVLAEKLPEREE